jgi:hypothetical protein
VGVSKVSSEGICIGLVEILVSVLARLTFEGNNGVSFGSGSKLRFEVDSRRGTQSSPLLLVSPLFLGLGAFNG